MADGDGPGRKTSVPDEEILSKLRTGMDRMNAPALSTSDIAELLPISRQAVKRRLENLAEEGKVGVHQAGRNRFWWISDESTSNVGFDLNNVVDPGDLSNEKVIDLFQAQVDERELPEELVERIVSRTISPEYVQDETVLERLRNHMEYTDLPEDITEGIALEVFGYDPSYWERSYRRGMTVLGYAMILFLVAILLVGSSPDPPSVLSTVVGEDVAESILRGLGLLVFMIWLASMAVGGYYVFFGGAGERLFRGEKPPWSRYIDSILEKDD